MRLPRCEGIVIFKTVPAANVDDYLPGGYKAAGADFGDATVSIHGERCDFEQADGSVSVAHWSQVRISIDKPRPPDSTSLDALDAYGLAWATDKLEFMQAAKSGTGGSNLGDYVFLAKGQFYSAPANDFGEFRFAATEPSQWAFSVTATVSRPDAAPAAPVHVSIWRDTAQETVRFDAVAGPDDLGGIRFGAVAEGTLNVPAGTLLASLLGDPREGAACSPDGTTCQMSAKDDNFVVVTGWRIERQVL